MGKRSRKARPEPGTTTRAERDARRAAPAPRRGAKREAPPAPWGSFPLSELVVFIALVFGVIGFIRFDHRTGKVMVLAAMSLGSLGGLEVSVREHFAGYRSHTTLLAASCAVGAMTLMILVSVLTSGTGLAVLAVAVAVGAFVFVLTFRLFRQTFVRRSGGLGFR